MMLALGLMLGIGACQSREDKASKQEQDLPLTTETTSPPNKQPLIEIIKENIQKEKRIELNKQHARVQTLIGSDSGVVRGIYLGDNIEKVLETEQAWLSEDSLQYKTFTIELNARRGEMIDIQYYTDSISRQTVSAIIIDVYEQDAEQWFEQMYSYYLARYGKPSVEIRGELARWYSPASYEVSLEKKTIRQAPGIRIRYLPQTKLQ